MAARDPGVWRYMQWHEPWRRHYWNGNVEMFIKSGHTSGGNLQPV